MCILMLLLLSLLFTKSTCDQTTGSTQIAVRKYSHSCEYTEAIASLVFWMIVMTWLMFMWQWRYNKVIAIGYIDYPRNEDIVDRNE